MILTTSDLGCDTMCLSCGCHLPTNTHSDPRHFTLADLKAAADAAGITPVEATNNIVDTVVDILADPKPSDGDRDKEL